MSCLLFSNTRGLNLQLVRLVMLLIHLAVGQDLIPLVNIPQMTQVAFGVHLLFFGC